MRSESGESYSIEHPGPFEYSPEKCLLADNPKITRARSEEIAVTCKIDDGSLFILPFNRNELGERLYCSFTDQDAGHECIK